MGVSGGLWFCHSLSPSPLSFSTRPPSYFYFLDPRWNRVDPQSKRCYIIFASFLLSRNNLQNERITFSLARAHELWLHARGVAGAHVLLRLEPGQDAEEQDLEFAADVAAYFSKDRQVCGSGSGRLVGWSIR